MVTTTLALIFASLTLLAVSLQKTYQSIPPKELKRRARNGDEFARLLYRAVGYGYSLEIVLWGLIGITAAGFFLITARVWPSWLAFIASAMLIWLGFFWVPSGHVTKLGLTIAVRVAPALSWLLGYIHPLLDKIIAFVRKHRPIHFHTGLYDKEDLVELLEIQRNQSDSRIEKSELEIAVHALQFGDKIVRDILTPRRVVKTVSIDETIGPVLMTELHDSGFSRFPVFDGESDNIVGTLYLRDVTRARTGGKVKNLIRSNDICYLHEEQPLGEALQAILKTHRHLMIVVNSFEEYVGVVTIEDVLEQIVGHPIVDEFDQYDDMRAVAKKMAAEEHLTHVDHAQEPEAPVKPVEHAQE